MIREINVKELTDNISEMCIQANHYLSPDMDACMKQAVETEKSELGKKILNQLQENLEIADKRDDPDLSGYRNGRYFYGNRAGRTFCGR